MYEILKITEANARRSYGFMEKKMKDYRKIYDEVREIVDDLSFCIINKE